MNKEELEKELIKIKAEELSWFKVNQHLWKKAYLKRVELEKELAKFVEESLIIEPEPKPIPKPKRKKKRR